MIFNSGGAAAGPISLSGTTTVALTAPTTGPYAGVVIFQDRSVTAPVTVTGNATLQVGGVIYAPAASVTVWGSVVVTPSGSGGGIIAQSVAVGGNASVTIDPGSNRPKVPEVRLVD